MTEHRNIPLPGDEPERKGNEGGKPAESSLFERASGAFGFDPFKPAPIKGRLPDAEMKRAKVRRRDGEAVIAPADPVADPVAATPVAPAAPAPRVPEAYERPVEAPVEAAAEPALPVPVAPSQIVVQQEHDIGAVALAGRRCPVDRAHLRDQGLIVPEATVSALLEEFRIVKRAVLGAARERGTAKSRRVLICSPHPGEGKTFCAANLAIAMAAERDSEVLLIDADFAKPSILSTFGLPKGPGFMDCLADPSIKPEELVIGTDIPGLWVLPSGNQLNADSEYLASDRTEEVLDRLTMGAPQRMLVFDTPPALAASPAAELAKHVGQAVLVARADRTGQSALEDACQLLSACPDIKLLLNAAHFSPSGRKFGSYYGYGE